MSSAECQKIHRDDREVLMSKYRHALEGSLAQAQWMTTQSISILQSVTLYLVSGSDLFIFPTVTTMFVGIHHMVVIGEFWYSYLIKIL